MSKNKIICLFKNYSTSSEYDIEISIELSCDDLVHALCESMQLNIEIPGNQAYFRSENPIALIQGEKTLGELGLHTGSMIIFER